MRKALTKEYTLIRQFYAWVGFSSILTGLAYGATKVVEQLIVK